MTNVERAHAARGQRSRGVAAVVPLQCAGAGEAGAGFDNVPVTMVRIASLVWEGSARSHLLDEAHGALLAQSSTQLPPILVQRRTMRIIRGFHRAAAAQRRGRDDIEARVVDVSDDTAFLLAVEDNVRHGLPLSHNDRRLAAARILQTHPEWADRLIGAKTGLSDKTVGAIRCATAEIPQLHTRSRVGSDGRVRPSSTAGRRQKAAELIAQQPKASLREIALAAGISASTARNVRDRVARGEDPVPARQGQQQRGRSETSQRREDSPGCEPTPVAAARADAPPSLDRVLQALSKDPALRTDDGRELLRWVHSHVVRSADSARIPASVADHCVGHLIEVAHQCAANLARIADDLAERADHRHPGIGYW